MRLVVLSGWLAIGASFGIAQSAGTRSDQGVLGDWREPGGSVLRIAHCGADVCARLVALSDQAPSPFDTNNPDAAKRSQRLCGLAIGYGFHLADPQHAADGRLYDPKSGKTYHGEMTSQGDQLKLRGYVGLRAFGRTEEWTRVAEAVTPCR